VAAFSYAGVFFMVEGYASAVEGAKIALTHVTAPFLLRGSYSTVGNWVFWLLHISGRLMDQRVSLVEPVKVMALLVGVSFSVIP
jgi:hypothetical protein